MKRLFKVPSLFWVMRLGGIDDLNGVVGGYADCYSKGPGFESRASHGPSEGLALD
jgi:hypothetical protein